MTEHVDVLPRNGSPLARVIAQVNDPYATLIDVFNGIPAADAVPAPSLLPFLVWEYGLGELSVYIPNLYSLIGEGVAWQRLRGTPASVRKAIGWLGYTGALEYEPARHRRWNRFQLALGRVRDDDAPDLARLEGVTQLSAPARSLFRRGFAGYDVRAAETSYQRFSGSIIGDHSGVRLGAGKVKWSFGRTWEISHVLTQTELLALGTWIEPIATDYWVDADYLWGDADFLWATPAVQARRDAIIAAISGEALYIAFRDGSGDVIGYARAMARAVAMTSEGEYTHGSAEWTSATSVPTSLLIFARTGFGDGAGQTAAAVSIVCAPTLAPGVKPGAAWVDSVGLSGGTEVGSVPVTIPLGATVRDRVSIMLGLDGPYTVSG